MKNTIFLFLAATFLWMTSCEKNEAVVLADKADPTQQGTIKNNNVSGDPNSSFRLNPDVQPSGPCYNIRHSGYSYDVFVNVTNAKPYPRRVTIYGWLNGNRRVIPNTYSVTIPAHSTTSSRIDAFSNASSRYSSILVEIFHVSRWTGSGWAPETDYRSTCASIPVENCYMEDFPCRWTNTCDGDNQL